MYGEVATCEIAVAPLHQSVVEPISCLQFSTGLEVLWAGSATGGLYTLQCQAALQRYSCVRAHESRVHDMCSLGNGVLSLSSDRWRCHSAGGLSKLTFMDPEVTDLAACEFEPGSASCVMLGREDGSMLVYDLEAQKPSAKAYVEGGVVMMRAPVGRGLVAIGNAAGQLVLTDPRAGYKAEHSLTAHSGGLEALDARGNFVATCGYGTRLGQVALDNMVKVYDLRSVPRLLNTVPFRPGPSLVRFHPKFSSTLLIGSQAGIFTLSDIQGTAPGPTYQIETEGDAITACAFSSSGEMMAFGGSGGYTHLWATSATPRVNMASQPLDFPTLTSKPPRLTEQDSFALPFPYGVTQSKLLSDFSFPAPMQMRQPPRIIPPALLKDVRQVEFVGYVANPMYKRGAAPGEASKAVAALRNMRPQPKQASLNAAANAARTRGGSDSDKSSPRHKGPRGATWLPSRYRLQRVHVQRQAGLRWADEFDFTFYNRTRFAGLENGVANCYVNSLVQVLFFIPAVRKAMLSIIPEPDKEFSLSCEMSLLFRMLYTARGSVCQASNLFRALRQNKEAAALGLLEGHAQQGPRDKDIEVETQKDRSLRRRIQSLQCFLFEQLHRELTQLSPSTPPGSGLPAKAPSEATLPITHKPTSASTEVTAPSPPHASPDDHVQQSSMQASAAAAAAAATQPITAAGQSGTVSSDAGSRQQSACSSERIAQQAAGAEPATRKSIIEATFGLVVRQRTKVTTGLQTEKLRESRSFQVELHYPPAKDRPPVQSPAANGATPKPAPAGNSKRPRFCDVLACSLKPQADLRAWFDEQLGYQPVHQTRIPLNMPNVLAMTCGLTDGADLAWWQPWRTASTHRPWLPWAIAVQVHIDEWRVEVQEGERFQDMLKQQHDAPPDGKVARAVYELTAVVAHVVDAAENSPAGTSPEGHLVAHVKVLPQDVDSHYGIAHSPIGPSPSQSPLAFRPFGSAPAGPPSAYSSALARTASASTNSNIPGTALARTASTTGSSNISRLSESTTREAVTGVSSGPTRVSSENTGVSSGEVLAPAQSSQQSLTSLPEEDRRLQSAVSLTSDVDSLPGSDPAASQLSTAGNSTVGELDKTVTPSAPSKAQQSTASGDQADTGDLQFLAGQLSINAVLAAGPLAASEGLQATDKAPAAAPNEAELQQSMDAILSGEDQAMQESLAAANAAGGEHVSNFLPSRSSGLQLLSTAEPSSCHTPPPEEEAAALAAGALPAGDGPIDDEPAAALAAGALPAGDGPIDDEPAAEATGSNQQPASELADGPALEKSDGSGQIADRYRKLSVVAPPASVTGLSSASSRHMSDGQPPSPSTSSPAYRRPDWLLFNDFSITPCAPAEVLTLFGNQKVPCLLYYSRVDRALTPAEASVPPAAPSPVLTTDSFHALCSGPPVQGLSVKRHARNFEPLSPEELKAPGLLLGIDAEFVAHAPAEKVMQGGVEVEVCKARLGLARVSVVRGEGPAAASPAIDDYIRSLEPISDYLTKWSGLVPGDLDPKVSPHNLTTMKKAYLKLRYLVDSGCVFVGHDLRHDFKSINIIVPPQQVIDTVFLFHFKRQRKLSLRFLAGYLLGEDIQQNTHDSIEDARTAVKLYQKYKQLVSEGRFQETLLEMYRWGKQHAWDPLALRPPTPPA
ncbi:hypothetical protein WJX77_000104 [Trebouxia sp. C0004]